MKQLKTLKVDTVAKDIETSINKTKKEIANLELSLADKKDYLKQLEAVRNAITN